MLNNPIFRFKGIEIHYDLPNRADVYFLTNDNEYNKSVNELMKDRGYKRLKLLKSSSIVEVGMGLEYERQGVYIKEEPIEKDMDYRTREQKQEHLYK